MLSLSPAATVLLTFVQVVVIEKKRNQEASKMSGVVKSTNANLAAKAKKSPLPLPRKNRGDSLPYGYEEELLAKDYVSADDVARLTSLTQSE